MWIIGDEMTHRTYNEHFEERGIRDNFYILNHYNVTMVAGGPSYHTKSVIGCVRNCFIHSYNNYKKLPKWVVFVPKNDIIKGLSHDYDATDTYEELIQWLFKEIKRLELK